MKTIRNLIGELRRSVHAPFEKDGLDKLGYDEVQNFANQMEWAISNGNGNSYALRDALVRVVGILFPEGNVLPRCISESEAFALKTIIDGALEAKPRNCDLLGSYEAAAACYVDDEDDKKPGLGRWLLSEAKK